MRQPSLWTWSDDSRLSLYTDGEKFVAELRLGPGGETLYAVGYSSPNRAWAIPSHQGVIRDALDRAAGGMAWPDDPEDSLPNLLALCKEANRAHNDALDTEVWWRNNKRQRVV